MSDLSQVGVFLKHRVYDPVIQLRNFDHDLPETLSIVKRTAAVALPFLTMYKPIGSALAIGMGGTRVVTHLVGFGTALYKKEALTAFFELNQTAFAVVSVATATFNFQIGLLVTSLVDVGTSLTEAVSHLRAAEKSKAAQSLMHSASSLLYVSFMVTGTLEVMLASILLQGALSLYQAAKDLQDEHYLEAIAKIALGCVRLKQACGYVQMIQRRNALFKLERLAQLIEKIQKGHESSHLIDSTLHQEKERVVMMDASGKEYDFGTHYHGTGKGLVKGMNLQFRTTVVDGRNMKNIDFKVNHAFRDKIQGVVEGMQKLNSQEIQDLLALTRSHAEGIKIIRVPFKICEEANIEMGEAYKVTLDGLGDVFIGASKEMPGIYDTVRIQIDEDKSLHDMHEMLSFFDLDDALKESSSEDIERMKIGQLFRMFYPVEATKIERKEIFFELSVDELKKELIELVPEMEQTLDLYLDKMETIEILPGRLRYTLPDISKIVYNLGARSLISTIIGNATNEKCDRVISILKMGMNSTEVRYHNGLSVNGLSSEADFKTGGADSVFTQLLTQKNFQEQMNLGKLNYQGDIRILFSLDVLKSGTYQYHDDSFGARTKTWWGDNPYLSRLNIFEFVKEEQALFKPGNEVMIKERIDPSLITGILVSSDTIKTQLLYRLRTEGLITNVNGLEVFFDTPVDKFIQVATKLSDQMLS